MTSTMDERLNTSGSADQERTTSEMSKIRYFYNRYHSDSTFRERMREYNRLKYKRKTETCVRCKLIRAKIPEDGSDPMCIVCKAKC